MYKVAVAGGNGFIGRHFIEMYSDDFSELRVLGRSSEPSDFEDTDKLKHVHTDYEVEDLREKISNIDYLVVLAGQREASSDYLTYLPSIKLYSNLLEASVSSNIKKIIFSSSISVFGDRNHLPWKESEYPITDTMYGAHKLSLEQVGAVYNKKHQLPIVNLRFAHIYGANEKNNYMINLFMRKAYNKEPITLNNPPKAKRDFLYVKDAAKSIRIAIESDVNFGVYNITANEYLTNLEVAEYINAAFSNPHPIEVLHPDQEENISSSYMAGHLAKEELNFEASYNMLSAMEEIKAEMEKFEDVPIFY